MTARLDVKATLRARQEIRVAAAWWRENRPAAPDAVAEDVERAFELVAVHPEIGAVARNTRLAGVRRILLGRIRYYVYYRVIESPPQVELLAFRHTSRGSGPGL